MTTSAARKGAALLPLEEFKRIVRGRGFTRATELKSWLRSAECPQRVPKNPHNAYRLQGWVSYLEAMGRSRARHQEISSLDANAGAASTSVSEDDSLSRRFRNFRRADSAIAWVEGLLAEFGYETQRLPRRLHGSLLVRETLPDSENDGESRDKWWALQIRSRSSLTSNTRTVVVTTNQESCAGMGFLVVNPAAMQARALLLSSRKLRTASSGFGRPRRLCFSLPTALPSVIGDAGRLSFHNELRDTLRLLSSKSRLAWLAELPGNEQAVRRQKLYLEFMETLVAPSGFHVEESLRFADSYDLVIEGRKCVVHSCCVSQKGRRVPALNVKRMRVVDGHRVSFPLGEGEGIDFVIALMYNKEGGLTGLFVFPYAYLAKRGVVTHQSCAGQTVMSLYLPGAQQPSSFSRNSGWTVKRQQQTKMEQSRFYFDMARNENVVEPEMSMLSKLSTCPSCLSASNRASLITKFQEIILADYTKLKEGE
ncbi:unnamed protein product [Amoebophrya sp. A25]|nr:unnamed protein product [Amoebophrya sp. A25]|eukprot:GSA25T00015365001.1